MTQIHILVTCPACVDRSDDQPNHCRACGGRGRLRSMVTPKQLASMGETPTVLGASVILAPKQRRPRTRKVAA